MDEEQVNEEVKKEEVVYLPIDKIMIPDTRVTSVVDPDIMEELRESVRQKGILQPLHVAEVDGQYVLIDGLHRLYVARELGIKEVPCIVRPMTMDEVLIQNLIVNRQRGRSNPAQEAEVLERLINEFGYSINKAAEILGISRTKARKLLAISKLPEEVKDLLKHGKLQFEAAYLLTFLEDKNKQIEVANDAVRFGYTVEQVKARVQYELNPQAEPEAVGWTFSETGAPEPVYPKCFLCGEDVVEDGTYIWIHKGCLEILEQFKQEWEALTKMEEAEKEAEKEVEQEEEVEEEIKEDNEKKKDWFSDFL